jgi:hypothetical protein
MQTKAVAGVEVGSMRRSPGDEVSGLHRCAGSIRLGVVCMHGRAGDAFVFRCGCLIIVRTVRWITRI